MIYTLERVTDPAIEVIDLAEMKRHLRMWADQTAEDDDVTQMIKAAREWVEDYTGRALIDQTWRMTVGDNYCGTIGGDSVTGCNPCFGFGPMDSAYWSRGQIMLRRSPVLAVTSFVSIDADGVETTIAADTYEVQYPDSKWPRLVALSGGMWNSASPLQINFRAGYADRLGSPVEGVEKVPARFKQAMKLWAEAMKDRDAVMTPLLIKVAEQLIKPECCSLQIA
jgi:hypothetical protein